MSARVIAPGCYGSHLHLVKGQCETWDRLLREQMLPEGQPSISRRALASGECQKVTVLDMLTSRRRESPSAQPRSRAPLSQRATKQVPKVISEFNRSRDFLFVEDRPAAAATLQ
jgi:hypothetical protein